MTREFEKYFPLPWKVGHNKFGTWVSPCISKIKNPGLKEDAKDGTLTVWQSNGESRRYKAIRYAVKCANLMPEAAALINTLRIELGISCIIWCGKGESSCKTCPAWEALRKAETFLAKLEGGNEQ